MASATIDDLCYRVSMLERALSQEAKTFHSVKDPPEATLVAYHVIDFHFGENKEYALLLNESTSYMHRQSSKEILSVQEPTSKKQEKCQLKIKFKPLPSHLMYEFLNSAYGFSIIASAKLDGP